MAIGDRIKAIRGNLSRDKFAPQTGISKTTLVNYETGERNPPSDYLVKILELYPDINPTWLLMGEGVIHRVSGSWWSERMKEIRGNLTIPELVRKVGFKDPSNATATIQAIEDGKMDADYSLMLVLYCDYGINPTWMLGGDVPMKLVEVETTDVEVEVSKTFTKINSVELYRAIVKSVHELDKELELKFTSKDKILTALITYIAFTKDICPETGKFIVDVEKIKYFIKFLGIMKHIVIGPLDSLNLDNMYNIVSHIMGLVEEDALYDKVNAKLMSNIL
jgi:hypothetical protein